MEVPTSSAEESNFHDNQAHEQYKEVTLKQDHSVAIVLTHS